MKITPFNPPVLIQDGITLEGDQSEAIYHHYFMQGEKIRPEELGRYGYRLTARHIAVGGEYKVFELLPIESAYHASHSYLAPNHRISGVIIPRAFTEHKAAVSPLAARARYTRTGKRKSRVTDENHAPSAAA